MRYGFVFPREHGLVAIWSSTLIFGLILGLVDGSSILGLFVSLLFSFAIIFSYNAVKKMVGSAFEEIAYIPLITVLLASLIVYLFEQSVYSFLFFFFLFILVSLWATIAVRNNRQSYIEIILGSLALTLQFPIIYNLIAPITSVDYFLYIMAIWWIYTGAVLVIIINVGCYRNKIGHSIPLMVWILYMLTFIPMFSLSYLEPIALILMIEPTYRSIKQAITKDTMRSKKLNIKKIGWNMVIALYSFILIVFFFAIFNIPLTNLSR